MKKLLQYWNCDSQSQFVELIEPRPFTGRGSFFDEQVNASHKMSVRYEAARSLTELIDVNRWYSSERLQRVLLIPFCLPNEKRPEKTITVFRGFSVDKW